MKSSRFVLGVMVSAALYGCGGGGGGDSGNPPSSNPPPSTAPTVTISVSPGAIPLGDAATLSWSSTNATSCEADGDWTGGKSTTGTEEVTPDAEGSYVYELTCTGSGGSVSASATLVTGTAPSTETSYDNFKSIGLVPRTPPPLGWLPEARGYADFDGDGELDLLTARLTYNPADPIEDATPSVIELWLGQSDGSWVLDTSLLSSSEGCMHPRKGLVADFNSDGKPDVFIACHGYDAMPFPGEKNKLVLSQEDDSYDVVDASDEVGFFHSAAAADITRDGHVDVLVNNHFDDRKLLLLENQGDGTFEVSDSFALPNEMASLGPYFTTELVDVDGDGSLDLIMGGHEWEGAATVVLINPGNNDFSEVTPVTIPSVANEGVVLDFTVTESGDTRTIWVVRSSGGDGSFYQSRVVQRVRWPSLASTVVLQERPAVWLDWAIPAIVGGDPVLTSDNADKGFSIPLN